MDRLVAGIEQSMWSPRIERDGVARPEQVLVETDVHAEPAAEDVAPLLAAVALELVFGTRRPADLVGHVEEVDIRERCRRQPLPDDARREPDGLAALGPLDRSGGHRRTAELLGRSRLGRL